ncbi:MAG TPA: adenosylcobinamide-GDP ribazoletransferase [Bradyrhizobium sp.]|jgi:adenosylcobinamide-GDP ribazoletransferase|nr:adenosylcobinamide-GDP ribazoletransferase [Bradyrhizobium sp.]
MADTIHTMRRLLADLRIGISLCTRVPLAPAAPVDDGEVARASWTFPIAGFVVGLVGAFVYWLAVRLHVPPEPAAVLALTATVLVTGAMHEDGLADTADALGGSTRERKLQIMRDSRIGTFGTAALALSFLLRWTALAEIAEMADARAIAIALIVAHTASRAVLPAFMYLVPPARADGLSTSAGRPPQQSVVVSLGLGILCLLFAFGPKLATIALLMLALAALVLARLAVRQIGGQTGDVLGAQEQIGEAILLLIASTMI